MTYPDDMTPDLFRVACLEYAKQAIEEYDEFDVVTLEGVVVEVSQKLKRAAGKAGESKTRGMDYFMRFAFGAYQKWGWGEEVESTIRHELIHIKQYQTQGTGGHGMDFKRMADAVDAPRHCKSFTDFNFGIFCEQCDNRVAGRYRKCKMTRRPEAYRSKCCSAPCYSERL